jgi:hypothetical protein
MPKTLISRIVFSRVTHSCGSRFLPSRTLLIIREYSKPRTRFNWRQSKPIITCYRLYLMVKPFMEYSKNKRLYRNTLYNILMTDWFYAYSYIKCYGYVQYIECFKYNIFNRDVDGINEAVIEYNK